MRERSFLSAWIDRLFSRGDHAQGKRGRSHRPQSEPLTTDELADQGINWLVVGLGNPGARYEATRHNVGYMAIDDLLAEDGDLLRPVAGLPCTAARVVWEETPVLLVRSTTFMNNSGEAIGPLARALGVPANRIILAHDELDLPFGAIKLRQGGNENGHNGLKSTSGALGTRDFLRIRMGIGRPPRGTSVPDYVLGPVDAGPTLDELIAHAAEAARLIVTEGLAKAQNRIHSR